MTASHYVPRWVDPSVHPDSGDVVIDVAPFRALNRHIASGTPVALVGALGVPYDPTPATVTGAGVIVGHVLEAVDTLALVRATATVRVLTRGRVIAAAVAGFTTPVVAKRPAAVTYG